MFAKVINIYAKLTLTSAIHAGNMIYTDTLISLLSYLKIYLCIANFSKHYGR